MSISIDILNHNGHMTPNSKTQFAATLWQIPNGCSLDDAKLVTAYFEKESDGKVFVSKYKNRPYMAELMNYYPRCA